MVSREFIEALTEARRRFSAEQWSRLVKGIEARGDCRDEVDLGALLPDAVSTDGIWLLSRLMRLRGTCSWAQVAAVLAAVDALRGGEDSCVTPVWTGPSNGMFPVRRFDQVLYDLVAQANRRILIVTFAAYRVEHLCELLSAAMKRGATLTLVLEGEENSGGQLTRHAANAFRALHEAGCPVYCWPRDRRARNAAGRPAKLHAKCAVVDDTALVGSANLTEDAFNRNMELGLAVNDCSTADAIYGHFSALITHGELMRTDVRNQ